MILVIDNYDSFVHNLARYIRVLGFETLILRNDEITCDFIKQVHPDAMIISPGPKGPKESGNCLQLVRTFSQEIPMLGICLGHQILVEAFGGSIIRSSTPTHGRSSLMHHDKKYVFEGIPSPMRVGRYHSLCAQPNALPECMEEFGRLDDGTVMAIAHRKLPIIGLQFHPESILTDFGYRILGNFFRYAGLPPAGKGGDVRIFVEPLLTGLAHDN